MTSKERMRRAMSRTLPDRVPVMCQMSIGHLLLQTGSSPAAFWNSAEVFASGLLALRESYLFDGILVSLYGHRKDWERHVSSLMRQGQVETVAWQNGDETVFPPDDLPRHYPSAGRPVPPLAGFDAEGIPEAIDFIPVSQGLDFFIDPDDPYRAVDLIVGQAGREFSVHGEVTSPFDYYLRLFGHSQALIGLVEEPDRAKAVLKRYTDGLVRLAGELVDHGVDAVKLSSPYAGSGFISPRFYREFIMPYEGEIARAVRLRGVPVYVHTCGAVHDRLEMMVEAGFSGVECLDPPPIGDVDLADAKRRVGGRIFIKGNIDPVHVLLNGSAETVEKDARSRLDVAKPGGMYILSTACSIAPRTPPQNIRLLAEIAADGGRY
ncbi:MAG: uroporphyrinogen decarboxylase family protein [Candidatus Aminicenantales bacterium]